MDRIMSDEERIRRAEAVAERRQNKSSELNYEKIRLEKSKSKSKMILMQIFVCLLIYCGLYYVKNLPEDNNIKKQYNEKINWILNYDIDINKIYNELFNKNNNQDNNNTSIEENKNSESNNEELSSEILNYGIGGELNQNENTQEDFNETDDDVEYIKSNINLIIPIDNYVVTSRFGQREASEIISSNHKGIDLGATTGTEIKSACDGKVIKASSGGDFGKHVKIQNGDAIFIYAHCNKLFVNEGDEIKMGQKIAEVGSTGRATGPHLHFEIRRGERAIDPELILNFEK